MSATFGEVLESVGAARLLAATVGRDGLAVFTRLALVTGARRGELLSVRWADMRWPRTTGKTGMLVLA